MMSKEYTISELMASYFSRHIEDGWTVIIGNASWVPLASLIIARELYAPNITILSLGYAVNPSGEIPWDMSDYMIYRETCEAFLTFEDVFDIEESGRVDLFFAGGIQIDPYGGLNLVCVGEWKRPVFRGPGTIGLSFLPRAKNIFIWSHTHNRRVFVEKLDFHSYKGYRGKVIFNGPRLVVTNLCVMDFDDKSKRMRIRSIHPGIALEEVLKNTGFEPIVPDEIPTTEPPTVDELRVLREHDKMGVLKRLG
jgi:glutaconate CoA-transferase subunit B